MKKTILFFHIILFSISFLTAQLSDNMSLLGIWEDDTLPSRYGAVYNDVWGFAHGSREYAIIGSALYTHFIDVTNPTNLQEVARFKEHTLSLWRDYKTFGFYSYGMAQENDPSDPSGMQVFYHGDLPDSVVKVYDDNSLFTTAHNIFIDEPNGRLYVAGSNVRLNGLLVLDIATDPANPSLLASVNLPGGYVHDVYVRNNIAYCSHGNSGLYIYDFSNPTSPALIGNLTSYPQQGYNHSSWLTDDGNFLVFADETHGRPLRLLDITDLSNLTILSTFKSTLLGPTVTNSIPHNPIIRGDYVYISYYHDGIQVYDISDIIAPERVAYYDTDTIFTNYSGYEGAWGVYPLLPSKKILGSDQLSGLFVLKIGQNSANNPKELNPDIAPEITSFETGSNPKEALISTNLSEPEPIIQNIYPNPASKGSIVNLQIANNIQNAAICSIYDTSGKLIWEKDLSSFSENRVLIPQLSTGIYHILVKGNGVYEDRRLIILD